MLIKSLVPQLGAQGSHDAHSQGGPAHWTGGNADDSANDRSGDEAFARTEILRFLDLESPSVFLVRTAASRISILSPLLCSFLTI